MASIATASAVTHRPRASRSRRGARVRASARDGAYGRRDALALVMTGLIGTELIGAGVARADAEGANTEAMPTAVMYSKPRVVITGSNSGIGRDAATKLAKSGKWVVVLACRTRAKAEQAKADIMQEYPDVNANDIECYACDLGDLSSVRAFAQDVLADGAPVDALCLNAGVEYSGDPVVHRTVDGFEETIGVNHLGHFLLANLLLPRLEASEKFEHPRVVVTSSEVHDPSSPGGSVGKGATLGDLEGLTRDGNAFEMVSGEAFDADKAYKDSKLCNMLFTYELERRLQARGSKVSVNAFGPGLITRTGLFRHQQPLFVKVFDFVTNDVAHVAETVDGGGNTLLFMLTDPSLEGVGGLYFNNTLSPGTPPTGHAFVKTDSSEESLRADEAAKLWSLSEKLVNLA